MIFCRNYFHELLTYMCSKAYSGSITQFTKNTPTSQQMPVYQSQTHHFIITAISKKTFPTAYTHNSPDRYYSLTLPN